MWINFTKDELEHIASLLPGTTKISLKINERLAEAFDEDDVALIDIAKADYATGEVEIDEQSDGSVLVSHGDDGCWVMAWVFIDQEDMPERETQ